ncbi:MAG: ABC transporter ATP-binding protein [Methanothrix sp.]
MDEIAVHAENLGKRYRIGQRDQYKTLRDAITNAALGPLRCLKQGLGYNNGGKYFWALKDVSFAIDQGDVIGVIGRNGSGKSTLLKILSRITTPTEGHAELHGRVGSLLEVGTGFHPELTGSENIYLSGSIQGMRKKEIEEKFDEIVEFSQIEQFLDTPVKRYSSGMFVRLAFAVAAHLNPEILLIDEVLAVGDMEFQKKCIGKMGEVANEGRTVLFVSHNLGFINSLCKKCLLLEKGNVLGIGETPEIIDKYLNLINSSTKTGFLGSDYVGDPNKIRFLRLRTQDEEDRPASSFKTNQKIIFEITFDILELTEDFRIGIGISSIEGIKLFTIHQKISIEKLEANSKIHTIRILLNNQLRQGKYYVDIGSHSLRGMWWCAIIKALEFNIETISTDTYNIGYFSIDSELFYTNR